MCGDPSTFLLHSVLINLAMLISKASIRETVQSDWENLQKWLRAINSSCSRSQE